MIKTPIPFFSIAIVLLCTGVMLLPGDWQTLLYFDRSAINDGNVYSMVSGHFIHSGLQHWFWNCVAMLVLGTIIELKSKKLLLCSLIAGILAVDILLLSPFSDLRFYCGLSGVLNTLLITAFWLAWREKPSAWVIISLLLCMGKIIIEMATEQPLLVHISWPPYPAAHLAGAIAGGLLVACSDYKMASSGKQLISQTFTLFRNPT